MTYTIHNNNKINNKINNDLEYIKSELLSRYSEYIESILLCGSFGRGEGGVYLKGQEIKVVNDYDIIILLNVYNKIIFLNLYKKLKPNFNYLAEKFAIKLNIKQIDLDLKHISYFKSPRELKIENYEVKNGYKVLYGSSPVKLMPDWRASDLPLFEGTRLFLNRGSGLLIAKLYFNSKNIIPSNKRENFKIECNKAIIAIGDSILLLKKSYHHLYSKRLRNIQKLNIDNIPNGGKIIEYYKKAINQKLRPKFNSKSEIDSILWFEEIINLFSSFFLFYESNRLKKSITDWYQYSIIYKDDNKFYFKLLIKNLLINPSIKTLFKNFKTIKKYYFLEIMPLLLFVYSNKENEEKYFSRTALLLNFSSNKPDNGLWMKLVYYYLLQWHPGGEVKKILENYEIK